MQREVNESFASRFLSKNLVKKNEAGPYIPAAFLA